VTRASVHAVDVKFSQDLAHQNSLKSVSTKNADWVSLVSMPLIHNNHFSCLATTEDELSEGGRFEEQRSARVMDCEKYYNNILQYLHKSAELCIPVVKIGVEKHWVTRTGRS